MGTLKGFDNRQRCCLCHKPIEEHPDEMHMVGFESRGKIRIVKVPEGEAPLEIRKAWVGIVLPAFCFEANNTDSRGALSGKNQPTGNCYHVDEIRAIAALEKHNPDAAVWWRKIGLPRPKKSLCFNADAVAELEPVSPRL